MRAVRLLAAKDLRSLTRSRPIALVLLLYPLAIALLLGMLLLDTGQPTIALVNEDSTGTSVTIGGERFGIDTYRKQAEASGVVIVDLDRDEAMRALDEGQVAGVLVIPNRTIARLSTQLKPTNLEFHTGDNPLGATTTQRMRGVIYRINLEISEALVETNATYLKTLVTGGTVDVGGNEYDLYGLDPIRNDLDAVIARLDGDDRRAVERAAEFAGDAGIALNLADDALEATAAPLRLRHVTSDGKSPLLSAQAMSFALAVALVFICTVLVAGALAAERDDRVIGRLMRGAVSGWQLVGAKLAFGSVIGVGFATGLFLVFGALESQAWSRLPLLAATTVVASIAASAFGAALATIARDSRMATLLALMIVIPLVPLALTPSGWVVDVLSQIAPLEPSRHLFNAVLFDRHPWSEVARGVAHLGAITLATGALATGMLRRLT